MFSVSSLKSMIIYFGDTPGFGDQSFTLHLLKKFIKNHGFKNKVHLIYKNPKKLGTLLELPSLPIDGSITIDPSRFAFELNQLKEIRFTSFDYFKNHKEEFLKAEFGFIGTDLSHEYLPDFLKAKTVLALKPPKFYPFTPFYFQNEGDLGKHIFNAPEYLKTSVPSFEEIKQYLQNRSSDKNQALLELLEKERSGELFRQMVYGMRPEFLEYRLSNLLLAACRTVEEQEKSVVVQFAHPIPDKALKHLDAIIDGLSPVHLSYKNVTLPDKPFSSLIYERIFNDELDCSTIARIQEKFRQCRESGIEIRVFPNGMNHVSSNKSVILISTPNLPQPVFDFLAAHTSLPNAVEGANLRNLLFCKEKAFIPLVYSASLLSLPISDQRVELPLLPHPLVQQALWNSSTLPDEILYKFYLEKVKATAAVTGICRNDMLDTAIQTLPTAENTGSVFTNSVSTFFSRGTSSAGKGFVFGCMERFVSRVSGQKEPNYYWMMQGMKFFLAIGLEGNWSSGLIHLGMDYLLMGRLNPKVSTAISLGLTTYAYKQTGVLGMGASVIGGYIGNVAGRWVGNRLFRGSGR